MLRWLVFLFMQNSISHINTLHNCCGSCYSPDPGILSCACDLQLAGERSKKEMPLTCSYSPKNGIVASSYRTSAVCLSGQGRKSCHLMWRDWDRQNVCITLQYHSISPITLTCSSSLHSTYEKSFIKSCFYDLTFMIYSMINLIWINQSIQALIVILIPKLNP